MSYEEMFAKYGKCGYPRYDASLGTMPDKRLLKDTSCGKCANYSEGLRCKEPGVKNVPESNSYCLWGVNKYIEKT